MGTLTKPPRDNAKLYKIIEIKPLDIVKTPAGGIAIVTETNNQGQDIVISYIESCNPLNEKNAWWHISDTKKLKVIDSLPRLLAASMAHPFGDGETDVEYFFGIKNNMGANKYEN